MLAVLIVGVPALLVLLALSVENRLKARRIKQLRSEIREIKAELGFARHFTAGFSAVSPNYFVNESAVDEAA